MSNTYKHLFWDSCVFIRYLLQPEGADLLPDIDQFIDDAKMGKVEIHFSTIALAEIKPNHFKNRGYKNFVEFSEDMKGAFRPIGPSPDIMMATSVIRDFPYPHPRNGKSRSLGTADGLHLMTCLFAKETLGLDDMVFHTFDDGGGRNWEGKCVPLLSFQEWCSGIPANPYTDKICQIPRTRPEHPNPRLFTR